MLIRGAVILKADACLHSPKFIRKSSLIIEDQVAIHDPYGNVLRADMAVLFGCLQQHASALNMTMDEYIKKMTEELNSLVNSDTEIVNANTETVNPDKETVNANTENVKDKGETDEVAKSE